MTKFTRREFTRNLALASLFSPFVSLFEPGRVRAQPGQAKYLLVFFTNGTDANLWSPKGSSENNVVFSRMTEPLSVIKNNVVLVENLDSRGTAAGHAAPGGLTGKTYGAARVSVDQFVSGALQTMGINTQIPNLVLGGTRASQHDTFFRDGKAIDPIYSVTSAFETVFSGATGGGSGAASTLLARRKSILDALGGELRQLSGQLGSQEREKLDLYADSIRQLEERIAGQTAGGGTANLCATPAAPAEVSEDVLNSATHLDIAVNAFACDITRVAAVAFGNHQSCQVGIPEVERPGDWHNDFTHSDNGDRPRMTNLERWLCGEFVRVVNKLKSLPAPTGSGTLFDQTIILWARDMGDAVAHGGNMRFVLTGAPGYLKTSANGRYVDGGGQAHQRALLNCCEALGVTNYAGFGEENIESPGRLPLPAIGA